jgi:hypothetical protein
MVLLPQIEDFISPGNSDLRNEAADNFIVSGTF